MLLFNISKYTPAFIYSFACNQRKCGISLLQILCFNFRVVKHAIGGLYGGNSRIKFCSNRLSGPALAFPYRATISDVLNRVVDSPWIVNIASGIEGGICQKIINFI